MTGKIQHMWEREREGHGVKREKTEGKINSFLSKIIVSLILKLSKKGGLIFVAHDIKEILN